MGLEIHRALAKSNMLLKDVIQLSQHEFSFESVPGMMEARKLELGWGWEERMVTRVAGWSEGLAGSLTLPLWQVERWV